MKVTVLVTIHKGEKYLKELIDSLLNQTHKDLTIVLSNDCGDDECAVIMNDYLKNYPEKIVVRFPNITGGAKAHFIYLIDEFKESDFIMLADQDDVWLPDKVEKTLSLMLKGDTSRPRLVHTDAYLTDESLNVTADSFKKFATIPKDISFNRLLAENIVQGASAMINSALAKLAAPDDKNIVIHDWWLALIASAVGEIAYLDEPTFYYRQHSENVIGALEKPKSFSYILRRLKSDVKNDINKSRRQAASLLKRLENNIPEDKAEAALLFSQFENQSKFERISVLNKQKIMPTSLLKKIKFIVWG